MITNPFIIKGYAGKEFFCDRIKETEILIKRAVGGSDSTIISPRRYGKSGLILHTFRQLRESHPEYETLYTDIYATLSLGDLIDNLASAIFTKFPEKTRLGKKFVAYIKTIRPYFTFDEFTGAPQIHFENGSTAQKERTLKGILDILEEQGKSLVFAIDEFQQITEYPEKNIEALLRTCTQQFRNVRFIYCGSKRRLLTSMFSDAARPFYGSSETLFLDKLDKSTYSAFIRALFERSKKTIDEDALELVLALTRSHTYYTQRLCHNLFDTGLKNISARDVRYTMNEILDAEAQNFFQIRDILSTQQWRFLIGLAKEEKVSQITSSGFISKYKIGSSATSRRIAESLDEKELVLKTLKKGQAEFEVYNVFLSRWIEREY